jgi:hypothetical protein
MHAAGPRPAAHARRRARGPPCAAARGPPCAGAGPARAARAAARTCSSSGSWPKSSGVSAGDTWSPGTSSTSSLSYLTRTVPPRPRPTTAAGQYAPAKPLSSLVGGHHTRTCANGCEAEGAGQGCSGSGSGSGAAAAAQHQRPSAAAPLRRNARAPALALAPLLRRPGDASTTVVIPTYFYQPTDGTGQPLQVADRAPARGPRPNSPAEASHSPLDLIAAPLAPPPGRQGPCASAFGVPHPSAPPLPREATHR